MEINTGLVAAVAAAPGLALLWWFYNKDVLDPEPLSLVFAAFFRGILFVFPAGLLEKLIEGFFSFSPLLSAILGVALVEEYFKWLALRRFIASSECDECYDGIVYGTSVALGFATLENLFYVIGSINPWAIAGWRAVLSVPLHALCGLAMGYEAARQKLTTPGPLKIFRILLLPVLSHGIYNFLLLTETLGGVLGAMTLVFIMWIMGFRMIRRSRSCS
ncbi:MAG: PrsW family glutamic-type intramembrane protease [Thermovirgaceae bacterium]|nr:PrsW family glutamic-type intramembrane protease [Thermovirgaceae bacterium]